MEAQDRPLLTQEEDKPRTSEDFDDLSDGAPDVRGLRSSNERKIWPWLVVCTVTSAVVFSLLGALANANLRDIQPYLVSDCGDNVAEAMAKGCHFDVQTSAWVPEACRNDPRTVAEYNEWLWDPARKPRPFPYFADEAGQIWLQNEEVMSKHEGIIWTTWEEHLTHCAFMPKRFMRTWSTGKKIDSKMGTSEHAKHCSGMLVDLVRDGMKYNATAVSTRFHVDFIDCPMGRPRDNEPAGGHQGYR